MTAPQHDYDDRYVGSAKVPSRPIPVTAVPYDTHQFHYAPQPVPVRKRRSVLFYAGMTTVVFMILLLGMIVGLALHSGSPSSDAQPPAPQQSAKAPATTAPAKPADSPAIATEEFLAAVVSGDQTKANTRLCGLLRSGEGQSGGGLSFMKGLVSYKIGQEHVTGPGAAVDVELTMPLLGAINFDVYLVQETEGWRVCGAGPG